MSKDFDIEVFNGGEQNKPKIGWTVEEVVGKTVINPILLLPKEERERIMEAKAEKWREMREYGEPVVPGAIYVCPNGCAGPFRTHGTMKTLLDWSIGLDPNHWTEECSCEACGARFMKEWVWAKNDGRPWYSIVDKNGGKHIVYHGEPVCCINSYIKREQ